MNKSELIEKIRALSGSIRERGVTSLAIFGSRARGDHRAESDLDIVVDFVPGSGFSLIQLCAVERIIEEQIGIPVQATTRSSMSPGFLRAIEHDAIQVL